MVAVYCTGSLLFFCLNCRPIQANWDHTIEDAKCGNQRAGWLGTGVANIITDVIILSLPMPSVWDLQLPTRTKVAVLGVFGLGFM